MPDLITHTVAAYLIRKRSIPQSDLVIYLLGALLPDIATRPFMIMFPSSRHFFHAFHTPAALALIILLISLYFEETIRIKIIKLLTYGTLTHLILDMFQTSVGERGYGWLFPFSYWNFNFGLIWPEDSVTVLPLVIAVFFVDFILSLRKNKNSKSELQIK